MHLKTFLRAYWFITYLKQEIVIGGPLELVGASTIETPPGVLGLNGMMASQQNLGLFLLDELFRSWFKCTVFNLHQWWDGCINIILVKFIYSEKATKFCKISTLLLSYVVPVKSKVEILKNFMAFSEDMNTK